MAALAQHLSQLETHGLIRLTAEQPETEYVFRHVLIQDAAYASLVKADRRMLHHAVAETFERLYPDQLEELYGLLAYHYQHAEVKDKAFAYLVKAADHASARYANADAIRFYTEALALKRDDLPAGFDLLLAREKVYDLVSDRSAQAHDLEALTSLAEKLYDDGRWAVVALRRAAYAEAISDYSAAIAHAQQAVALAHAAGVMESEARGYLAWGRALWRQADYAAARTQYQQARALAQQAGLPDLEADCLQGLGVIAEVQSEYAEARSYLELSLDLYRQIGDRRGESRSLNSLGVVAYHQEDYATARHILDQSLRLKREFGDRYGEGVTLTNLGIIARHVGDYAAARAYFEPCLRLCREIDDREGESGALAGLGAIASHLGDLVGAQTYYEQALRLAREIGDRQEESSVLTNLSFLSHSLGNDKAARDLSQQAIDIARAAGNPHEQGSAWNTLGHALEGLGRLDEAADAYRQSLEIRRESGQSDLALDPRAGLARIALHQGDAVQARAHAEEILKYLETKAPNSTEESFLISLTLHRVLHAADDPRAQSLLESAYQQLQVEAVKITDEASRRSFLENVPVHRDLIAEWEARRSTP